MLGQKVLTFLLQCYVANADGMDKMSYSKKYHLFINYAVNRKINIREHTIRYIKVCVLNTSVSFEVNVHSIVLISGSKLPLLISKVTR